MNSRLLNLAVPTALLMLGTFVLWHTYTAFTEAGVGGGDAFSNSALFPRLIAWGLIIVSIILLLQAFTGSSKADDFETQEVSSNLVARDLGLKLRAIACFVMVFVYLLVLKYLGFYLATPMLMIGLFSVLGARPTEALGLGIISTIIVVLAFEQGLNVVFPVGRLGLF